VVCWRESLYRCQGSPWRYSVVVKVVLHTPFRMYSPCPGEAGGTRSRGNRTIETLRAHIRQDDRPSVALQMAVCSWSPWRRLFGWASTRPMSWAGFCPSPCDTWRFPRP
jgi:hypothetical protein